MPTEVKKEIELEIAYVLFIDIVGYSKLVTSEQRRLLELLNQIVRESEHFHAAEAKGRLITVPTGDGMALVFYNTLEAPVECALEVTRTASGHPELKLRMGIHSGPVSGLVDVSGRSNIAGAGINIAQRVMDCGDAGHILLSKHIAEDLEHSARWQRQLHNLGECEVKHGDLISVVNLYNDQVGNPQLPEKFRLAQQERAARATASLPALIFRRKHVMIGIAAVLIAAIGVGIWFYPRQANVTVSPPEKSVAVLPFENLSRDPDNAFFTDGIQDEILTDLAKIADLKVISRTSVMQYKTGIQRNLREIAQQLGVAHVLEGSVQRSGGRVRVSAQLIDARNDVHLWAERYDRDLADVFAIQSEIAKTIADQLQAKISPREKAAIEKTPTNDLAAFELYERAKALWADITDPVHAKEKLPQAAQLLDEAVARDPQFLLAWCLLSRVHGALYWTGHDHTPPRLELADVAVQTALRLQPDAGEVHRALATYYYYGFRDYARASSELDIARRSLPNDAEVFLYSGLIERREGHWEKATHNMERALELDPRNLFILQQLALTYVSQRRYTAATGIYDNALRVAPGDPYTRILRAQVVLDWKADIKPYQTTLTSLIAEDPRIGPDVDNPDCALCERSAAAAARMLTNCPRDGRTTEYGVNCPHAYWEGVVARWEGDSAKARSAFMAARNEVEKLLAKQPDFAVAISLLGVIDAGLEREEDALREGRRACELLPISKDAISGVALVVNLAQIHAWTGEKDRAIDQIAAVERIPNELSYGFLKLHPYWDSLRGDPRFEKIVASLAPKDIASPAK